MSRQRKRRQPTQAEWRLITPRRPLLRRIRRSQPTKKAVGNLAAEAKLPKEGE
jgi:hypothetical protein